MVARGSTVYHFAFEGTVSGESFTGPPAALASIGAGDSFLLTFDVDSGTHQIENIDANFVSKGIDLSYPGVDTGWTSYNITSPNEYRWDFNIPTMSPYTMVFWFRTTTPGIVTGGVPPTLDANQFNFLHEFDIYYNTGGRGPPTINVPLENTPEPATLGLAALGVLGILVSQIRWRASGLQRRQ
jgi:PEP-CTERM motif